MGSAKRLLLQDLLENLLGSSNVYFQPPPNVQMAYPCIVYNRDYGDTEFASNAPYVHTTRYQVTVIDKNPDNATQEKVAMLPMCLRNRFFTKDNLNHDVFTLYF